MTEPLARRAYRIFDAALALQPDARAAHVARECGADAALLAEVNALLRLDADGGLETLRLRETGTVPATADLTGRVVGRYRLLERIGGGGMGVVYRAERTDGIAQRVAVKIVRQELPDAMSRARFDIERESLARLEHPAIARLIDAGVTDERLPWYVMEYVDGVPIDRHCDERGLGIEQRLELLIDVCAAVDAAHRAFIVHRDIKPGNVLITADGQPKLIDFGIAKRVGESTASELTRETGALFTAHYASPEQVLGREVGVTADVHSLGALSYRLLTGTRIHATDVATDVDYLIAVTSRDVPPASRVSGRRALRGDLDRILAKALAREPRERYASAAELAAEFRRHLDHLPVHARPPSVAYRLGKLARRHRVAVALGALLAIASLAGLASYVLQSREVAAQRDAARREAAHARREAARAQAINEFLTTMLESADPRVAGKDVTVARVLDEALPKVKTAFGAAPEVATEVLATIARSNESAARFPQALEALQLAIANSTRVPDGRSRAAELRAERALVLGRLSRNEEAIREGRAAVAALEALQPAESLALARARAALAFLLADSGLNAESESLFQASLASFRRAGVRDVAYARAVQGYSHLLTATQRSAESVALGRESLAILETTFGRDSAYVTDARSALAGSLMMAGQAELAVTELRIVLERDVRVLGPGHVDTLWVRANVANALFNAGRAPEALDDARQAVAGLVGAVGADNQVALYARSVLASVLCGSARYAEGAAIARDVAERRLRLYGADHYLSASARSIHGTCLRGDGALRAAEPILLEAAATLERVSGPGYVRTQDTYRELVRLYELQGDAARAAQWRTKVHPKEAGP